MSSAPTGEAAEADIREDKRNNLKSKLGTSSEVLSFCIELILVLK